MNVTQYLYQSPSTSAVQVGRLDPSTKQEESTSTQAKDTTTEEKDTSLETSQSAPVVNEIAQQAEAFAATQIKEVTPTVSSNQLLDVYA
jgi:hypothetical protein